jgi:hypothetical protein
MRPAGLDELGPDELEAQHGLQLPAKTAMTTINASFGFPINNFAMPINLATAINNESSESWAIADADQVVVMDQTDNDGMAPPPGYDI